MTGASGRKTLSGTEAKRLHRDWRRRTERPLSLILDNVQTPFNVGSIVRTAASFRVEHLYVVGSVPVTPEHPKSKKTSLGTERLVPWTEHDRIDEAVSLARSAGLRVVGIELATAGRALHETTAAEGGTCLVLGHEDRGLSAAALAACDEVAYVPTPGKVGSLNVAVACAIALYEIRRQEWTSSSSPPSPPPPPPSSLHS